MTASNNRHPSLSDVITLQEQLGASLYRAYLLTELRERKHANPRYSLRAFARKIGTDPGSLSTILSGKTPLSIKMARQVCRRLDLAEDRRAMFIRSVVDAKKCKAISQLNASEKKGVETIRPAEVKSTDYHIIDRWYHGAILELTFAEGFSSTPAWIAEHLNISKQEATDAVERLIKLNLIELKDGKLVKVNEQTTTDDKQRTNVALKKLQKQFLKIAKESIDGVSTEERASLGMSMTIDPAKIPYAKKLIQEFQEQFCQLLEAGARKDVYHLQVNFFPLKNMESKNDS